MNIDTTKTPEIAIIGHPNEGKSSVLSTLAEDDSVRISPVPGETTICRTFPVAIDGREMLRFTDTPGFQNPSRVLAELNALSDQSGDCIKAFREQFKNTPELHDDVELLLPVERGAGIIYVVDGSRPLRNVDRAEMEILRLSGRPRMAIINCKGDGSEYLDDWKAEFRKSFNANRVFNAHRATYAERIALLETLKLIDQDWQPVLDKVVEAFKSDWQGRNQRTASILLDLFTDCLQHSITAVPTEGHSHEQMEKKLASRYQQEIAAKEQATHDRIKTLFKHNIFAYNLPPHSILNEDLFSEQVWELFGLSRNQLALLGGISGAALGASLDLATGGLSMGLVTGVSGLIGAATAVWGGQKLSENSLFGVPLGGEQLKIGPAKDINLLFVLINRAMLFYQHTINWAHGRRDYERSDITDNNDTNASLTAQWSTRELKVCRSFFSVATESERDMLKERQALEKLLIKSFTELSQ